MKVCYINYYNPLTIHGGAERVVLQEAGLLSQSGNDVIIITTHDAKGYRRATIKNGKIKVWFIPHELPFVHGRYGSLVYKVITLLLSLNNPLLTTHVNRILEIEQPDIVHIHSYGPMSISIINAAKRLGCKVILTFHQYNFECPRGSLYKRSGAICDSPHPLCRMYTVLYRKMVSRCDALIAICSYVKERLTKAGYSPNVISIIPNSLHNTSREFVARPDSTEILFVGRMVKAKGVHVLIRALAKVKTMCDKKFDVNLIGDGEHKVYFEALAQSFGIHANFLGKVSDRVLEEHYRNAYLVVVPSLFPELFGLVILEAISYGKPVIASRIGGIPELVSHGETGFLFEPNNADELAKYIKILLADEGLAIRIGDRAFKAAENFSAKDHLKRLLNLYDSILS